jgi:hypothetical protein
MSFLDWMRKKWYVLLICAGLGAQLMSVILQVYHSRDRYSSLVGSLLGVSVTYLIYKMGRPKE